MVEPFNLLPSFRLHKCLDYSRSVDRAGSLFGARVRDGPVVEYVGVGNHGRRPGNRGKRDDLLVSSAGPSKPTGAAGNRECAYPMERVSSSAANHVGEQFVAASRYVSPVSDCDSGRSKDINRHVTCNREASQMSCLSLALRAGGDDSQV